jgi:hypothetical protein
MTATRSLTKGRGTQSHPLKKSTTTLQVLYERVLWMYNTYNLISLPPEVDSLNAQSRPQTASLVLSPSILQLFLVLYSLWILMLCTRMVGNKNKKWVPTKYTSESCNDEHLDQNGCVPQQRQARCPLATHPQSGVLQGAVRQPQPLGSLVTNLKVWFSYRRQVTCFSNCSLEFVKCPCCANANLHPISRFPCSQVSVKIASPSDKDTD